MRDTQASPGLTSLPAAGPASERGCSLSAAAQLLSPVCLVCELKTGEGVGVGVKYSRISGQTGGRFRAASSHRLQAGSAHIKQKKKKKAFPCEVNSFNVTCPLSPMMEKYRNNSRMSAYIFFSLVKNTWIVHKLN